METLIRELFAHYGLSFIETRFLGRPLYKFREIDTDGNPWEKRFDNREDLGRHAIARLRIADGW